MRLRTKQAYVRRIRRFPGHADVRTTKIHTYVLDHGGRGEHNPFDVVG